MYTVCITVCVYVHVCNLCMYYIHKLHTCTYLHTVILYLCMCIHTYSIDIHTYYL